jgi:hypothetical protein
MVWTPVCHPPPACLRRRSTDTVGSGSAPCRGISASAVSTSSASDALDDALAFSPRVPSAPRVPCPPCPPPLLPVDPERPACPNRPAAPWRPSRAPRSITGMRWSPACTACCRARARSARRGTPPAAYWSERDRTWIAPSIDCCCRTLILELPSGQTWRRVVGGEAIPTDENFPSQYSGVGSGLRA